MKMVTQWLEVNRWKEYFESLLNEENENHFEEESAVEGPIEDITIDEVSATIKSMKNRKAAGLSVVASDVFKFAWETGMVQLLKKFKKYS